MKLQDCIHYYIGCRCINTWFPEGHEQYNNNWILAGYVKDMEKPYCLENLLNNTWTDSIKPILRKLEDITDEQFKDYLNWGRLNELYENVRYEKCEHAYILRYDIPVDIGAYPMSDTIDFIKLLPDQFNWLCKHGFDLFGLIENGLAIDSKTLTT